ncbi:hypothetical protein BLA24_06570 [Streptomyces cinnamoneus]|uniref:Transport permease protein n=1 Tax=Streptomyces cinnamoneus TaxID=53446 RepID=A0A2G1XME7_STRCJ|nr:ABC transporter permease [Streptomyces cinnamoneus]PHQ52444.1 hypothetical protein BLA24_06570 [Streptomyces cinnamoneus]PPT15976.1 ABC transporter permease [Streptomyces cinnamoneus]
MTASASASVSPPRSRGRRPGALRIGLARGRVELLGIVREPMALFFTLCFPLFMMLMMGNVFQGDVADTGVPARQPLVAGMIGMGVMSSSFLSLAIGMAQDQSEGTLKRLWGTPAPYASYFIGKIVQVLVAVVLQTTVLLTVGVAAFDVRPPDTAGKWATLAWVVLLGTVACSMLGLLVGSLVRSGRAAPTVATAPFIVLQFISGVYFTLTSMPAWIQTAGALFPLKWVCQGIRSALLPDAFLAAEPAGSWEHAHTAMVLGAWTLAGFAAAVVAVRWQRRRDA